MSTNEQRPQLMAWLETADGENYKLTVDNDLTLGRSRYNVVVVDDHQISRNHALVRSEGKDEYMLIDLGSTNGTYLNGRKIHRPVFLADRDLIELGSTRLVYRENRFDPGSGRASTTQDATVFAVKKRYCYLLIIDIAGFTDLSQKVPPEDLGPAVEEWIFSCRKIIERNFGVINRYLGDAVFAFWDGEKTAPEPVYKTIVELKEEQGRSNFEFRIILHCGEIRLGGASVSGEDNLLGEHVNFLFRIEKVASALKKLNLLSEAAVERLGIKEQTTCIGQYPVKDFKGDHTFFELA